MRADSVFGRVVALSCMVLTLSGVGLVPLADARLEAAAQPFIELHIEAEETAPCLPGHHHLFCNLCRAHERPVLVGAGFIAPCSQPRMAEPSRRLTDEPHTPAVAASVSARAPPSPRRAV